MTQQHISNPLRDSATGLPVARDKFCDVKRPQSIIRAEKKSVRFEKQVTFESALQIHFIPSNCNQNDTGSSWYGIKDLQKFELDYQRLSNRMKKISNDKTNSYAANDLDGFECPMLEIGSPVKSQEMGRTRTILAVLQAQTKQTLLGITSSMYIPTISKKLSKKDRHTAHAIALRTEKYVREFCLTHSAGSRLGKSQQHANRPESANHNIRHWKLQKHHRH